MGREAIPPATAPKLSGGMIDAMLHVLSKDPGERPAKKTMPSKNVSCFGCPTGRTPKVIAQLATKKINNAKAWTSDEDERLRKLVISNTPVFDIAADLGRTVSAVRARARALRISLGSSRFRMKAKGK
jgi:hypothetical protein